MPFYKLSKDAILETFDDGGLVLILTDRRLVELNPTAVDILNLSNGKRTTEQVAAGIASKFGISLEQATQDVIELQNDLYKSGVLALQSKEQEE
jgi:hypothetical protein